MLREHYRIGQAAGVSIHLLSGGEVVVHACSVAVKNNKLDIDKKVTELKSLDELKKHFPQKTLISLNLFGKGILQKQVPKLEEISAANFAQILPNADPDDFYIQHFVSGESSFVSVIRKVEADKWLEAIKDMGFIPMVLSLGPFAVQNIVEQLNFYDGDVFFDGHHVKRNAAKEWTAYRYEAELSAEFPLKAGAEVIDERLLLPYAAAFQLALLPDVEPIVAKAEELETQLDAYLSNKKLKVKGFLVLSVFFVLLLINFLTLLWLNSSNAQLSRQITASARNVSDIEGISEQVKTKEALLKTLGWDDGLNKGKLFDHLASLLPGEIRLLEMSVNPLDANSTRAKKSISFFDGSVRVVGSSASILPVNEWMARVKTLKWVKTVQMDSYAFNSELGAGQFTITITYQ